VDNAKHEMRATTNLTCIYHNASVSWLQVTEIISQWQKSAAFNIQICFNTKMEMYTEHPKTNQHF